MSAATALRRTSPIGADQWRARGIRGALSGGRRRPIADAVEPFPPSALYDADGTTGECVW